MKIWIFALTLLISSHAFADNSDKVEDLGTEVEAEQMDVYDQQNIDKQTRKEAQDLEKQSHNLESQMKQLQSESKNLSSRLGSEQEHYAKVAKLQRETAAQTKRLQAQRDHLKAEVDALRAKSSQAKSRLQSATELTNSLNKDIRDQNREKTQLLARQRSADERVQRAARDIKKLREQQHHASQENSRLQQKVAGSENRARNIADKSLESEL